jgi:hypothetical protein
MDAPEDQFVHRHAAVHTPLAEDAACPAALSS